MEIRRISDRAPVRFGERTNLVLDTKMYEEMGIESPATGPYTFIASTNFPGTGCYELTATWSGGSSTVRFPFVQPAGAASMSATPVASPAVATPSASAACSMPDAQAINLPIGSDGQIIRNAWGLGKSPLWLVGLGKTPAWYHPTDPGFVVSGVNSTSATGGRPGQRINVLWLMDPSHPQPVNVRGKGIDGGPDLFFENKANVGGSKEVNFTQGGGKGTVYMWWTTIVYTQPGCYEITATWASGSWTIRLPLPPPATNATPTGCATPVLPGTPPVTTRILSQAPPPFATRQPPIPYITPGIQQIATRPGIPLITPTPFATIVLPIATPATPSAQCR
jgi:hypothetical protein